MTVILNAREQTDSAELAALLTQRGPDGRRMFTTADIKHFVPMAVLYGGVKLDSFPALKQIMVDFIGRIGLPTPVTPDGFARAVHAYYRRHPCNRELERQFFAFCRSHAPNRQLDPKQVARYAKVAATVTAPPPAQAAMAKPKGPNLWQAIRKIARTMS